MVLRWSQFLILLWVLAPYASSWIFQEFQGLVGMAFLVSWKSIGILETASLKPHNRSVGVYKLLLSGEIVYIGRAIEFNNGGIRKRLSDYRRFNNSGRKHKSGQLINKHISMLEVFIHKTGSDSAAAKKAKAIEKALILKHQPTWNKQLKL